MAVSPMMQQYLDAKRASPDAILLFRMGDFYELFHDDAKTAARVLQLTLTSREKGEDAIPMAGFPHHQLENYLGKLIHAGFRVAVCDQVEDPKQAKGIVKREVTRIVTPGTLTDDALLDPRQSNFLAALVCDAAGGKGEQRGGEQRGGEQRDGEQRDGERRIGLAWVELSTGRFQVQVVTATRLADELARIAPAECLVAEDAEPLPPQLGGTNFGGAVSWGTMAVTKRPRWAFALAGATETLTKHFGTHGLAGFGLEDDDAPAVRAAGAILDYLAETQKSSLAHLERLERYAAGSALELDAATRRSLEVSCTLREARREGSLLAVLDRTVTAMGSRRLAEWLAAPLTSPAAIDERLDAIAELTADGTLVDALHDFLRGVYDLERLIARVTTGRATPRDLSFIQRTLRGLPALKAKLAGRRSVLLGRLEGAVDLCPELRSKLDAALVDDCPLVAKEGGFLRDGYHAELDRLRDLAAGGKQWIAQYQAEQIASSGIPSLKVGFNKIFGYYLEVTNVHHDKVPAHYIRKQTIKNSERYVTPELKEYEEQVVTADGQAKELEYELFLQLRDVVLADAKRLAGTARALADLDVLTGLAKLARERNYCRPRIVEEPRLDIVDGRHPVLDILAPEGTFVPNDTRIGRLEPAPRPTVATVATDDVQYRLDAAHGTPAEQDGASQAADNGEAYAPILLITGPNMAGKSTYIRQVALITLMAQMGSFVPARRATIGIADRIFARVGASDELSRGQSTFMVEMIETARILNTATPRSLVILDEIGRGTSTYDGLSLAWAVVEHLHEQLGCRTLFATHYHELTDLERTYPGIRNLNVAVREWQDEVIFLHKIIPGAADKSYGIHVARLAGVPRAVNERAKQILAQLEAEHVDATGRPKIARRRAGRNRELQLTLFEPVEHPIVEQLRTVDLLQTTPMQALALLEQWQREAGDGAHAKTRRREAESEEGKVKE